MISVVLPSAEMRDRLADRFGDASVSVWRPGDPGAPTDPVELLVLPYMIPPVQLRQLDGLPIAVVQSQTLGHDGVGEHLPSGIAYCNATDVHEGSTAELALGLILAAQRGIPDAVRDAAGGIWDHRRRPGLAGKRMLLIGVGGVGTEIIARVAPFGVDLDLVARTARHGVHGTESLPELLPRADIVVVAVPLVEETRRLVDAPFLAAMRDEALLVNVSRGEVVDTDALVAQLRTGRLRAALDVTDPEPLPPQHPLWTLPGVLITPHVGGDTDAMDDRVDAVIIEQVRRLRAGTRPLNLVHPAGR
ncbi:2-hydroxyacid dehydrogenase [Microbacterium terricola]|uniref:Dehydrogenase n=1 Tax=Microbacterium terricola TaxID=344163 RepID=A0ABM8DVR2_9MICO|nr:2-hydroxyacid dehydrogenase [Microbacterium terricola]UYK39658.1 2-hydroxyacid dehydrogenase [Microbacterium terricola]BDV29600.1 dehydrogenase [Microbacterium terricola]